VKVPQQNPRLNSCGFFSAYNIERILHKDEADHISDDDLQIQMDVLREKTRLEYKK
jgi:hypothetical protein